MGFRGYGARSAVLAAAIALVMSMSAPSAANAQLLGSGGLLAPVLCPTGGLLGAPVLQPITDLTCLLTALNYRWRTVFRRPDGTEVVREIQTLALVPTPINVDDDIAPDLIGTIAATSLTRFTLSIGRAPGETAQLPVQVEALITGPPTTALAGKTIAGGYDARTTRAPGNVNVAIELLNTDPAPGIEGLDVDLTTTAPGPTLPMTAELFSGTATARTEPLRLSAQMTPVPATFGARLERGPATSSAGAVQRTHVILDASQPTTVDAAMLKVTGPRELRLGAHIAQLPTNADVTIDEPPTGTKGPRDIRYTASAAVSGVHVNYDDLTHNANGTTTTALTATVDAAGVPPKMTVHQTSPRSASLSTENSGAIGHVEAGLGIGGTVDALQISGSGGRMVTDTGRSSFAARIDGIRSIDVSAPADTDDAATPADEKAAPFHVEARLNRQRLEVDIDQRELGRTLHGVLDATPAHVLFDLAPRTGALGYDGFGETIALIDATVIDDNPLLLGSVRRIEGRIENLPPKVNLNFAPAGAEPAVALTATARIGKAEVLLSSGPQTLSDGSSPRSLIPASRSGALVEQVDTGNPAADRLILLGRVFGLLSAGFGPTPGVLADDPSDDGLQLSGDIQAGPVTAIARRTVDGDGPSGPKPVVTQNADAAVLDFPGAATVTADLPNGHVHYEGAATIGRIDLTATQTPTPFFASVKRIEGRIDALPTGVDLHFADPAQPQDVALDASQRIGLVDVLMSSGPVTLMDGTSPRSHVPANEHGVVLQNVDLDGTADDRFLAYTHVLGLRQAHFADATPAAVPGKPGEPQPVIHASAKLDPLPLTASLDTFALPASGTGPTVHTTADAAIHNLPSELSADLDFGAGTIAVTTDTLVSSISADIHRNVALFDNVSHARALISALPAGTTSVSFKPQSDSFEDVCPDPRFCAPELTLPPRQEIELGASQRIGGLEVLLTSGPEASLPAGVNGAVLHKITDPFTPQDDETVIYGRVAGLRHVHFRQRDDGRVTVNGDLAPAPLKADVLFIQRADDPDPVVLPPREVTDLHLTTTALPGVFDVKEGPTATGGHEVSYDADAGVDHIRFDGTSTVPFFKTITRIGATVDGLPAHAAMIVSLGSGDTTGVNFSSTARIGLVEALLSSGPTLLEDGTDPFTKLTGDIAAVIEDVDLAGNSGDRLFALGRVRGLRSAHFTASDDGTINAGGQTDGGVVTGFMRRSRAIGQTTGVDTMTVDAEADELPADAAITLDLAADKIVYSDAPELGFLTATVKRNIPFFDNVNEIHATVQGIPGGATIQLPQPGQPTAFRFQADKPIGSVEATLTSGPLVLRDGRDPKSLLPEGTSGGVVERVAVGDPARDHLLIHGRVEGLSNAFFSETEVGSAKTGSLQVSTGLAHPVPFVASYDDEVPAEDENGNPLQGEAPVRTQIDATVGDLPATTLLILDMPHKFVAFNGDAKIDDIAFHATRSTPFFLGMTTLAGDVKGVPAGDVVVGFAMDVDGLNFQTTGGRLDSVELGGTSKPTIVHTVPDGQAGAFVDTTPADSTVFGRVFGLKSARFFKQGDDIHLTGDMQSGPFTAHLHLVTAPPDLDGDGQPDEGTHGSDLTLDAAIHDLPPLPFLDFLPSQGKVVYSGGATIGSLDLDLASAAPLFGRTRFAHVHGEELPSGVSLDFDVAGRAVGLHASPAIGVVDVRLGSSDTFFPAVMGGASGVTVIRGGDTEAIHARVEGLKDLVFDPDPLTADLRFDKPQKFVLDLKDADRSSVPLEQFHVHAEVRDVPSHVTLTTTRIPDNDIIGPKYMHIDYDADAPIAAISVKLENIDPLLASAGSDDEPSNPGVNVIEGEVRDLPDSLSVDVGDRFCLNPAGLPTGTPDETSCGSMVRATASQPVGLMAVRAYHRQRLVSGLDDSSGLLSPNFQGALPAAKDGVSVDRGIGVDGNGLNPAYAAQVSFLRSVKIDEPQRFIRADIDVDAPTGATPSVYPFQADLKLGVPDQILSQTINGSISELSPHMQLEFDTGKTFGAGECTPTFNCQPIRLHFSSEHKIDNVTLDYRANRNPDAVSFPGFVHVDFDPPKSTDLCVSPDNRFCASFQNDPLTGDFVSTSVDFNIDGTLKVNDLCAAVTVCNSNASQKRIQLSDLSLSDGLEFDGQFAATGFARIIGKPSVFSVDHLFIGQLVDIHIPPSATIGTRAISLPFLQHEGTLTCPQGTSIELHGVDVSNEFCSGFSG